MTAPISRLQSELAELEVPVDRASHGLTGNRAPVVLRLPLVPVNNQPDSRRPGACSECGSMGFNVHQRSWREIRDPQMQRVQVARYLCKRCGVTCRVYPVGIGPERQSAALRQICAMLYCIGLTYRNVQQVLRHLGCSLSITTIRLNVLAACGEEQLMRPYERLRLTSFGSGQLVGPDGSLAFRLIGSIPARRWLETEVVERQGGAELEWRIENCLRHFSSLSEQMEPPTGN